MTFCPDEKRILAETPLRSLHYFASIDSTNDAAKRLTSATLPALIVASQQTAGRGQRSNTWWSDEGSLKCSLLHEFNGTINSLAAATVAVATVNAIRALSPELDIRTKWPNDIYLKNKKVAGILIETQPAPTSSEPTRLIIGVGINSNCDMQTAPTDIQKKATSLKSQLKTTIDQNELIIELVNEIVSQFETLQNEPPAITEKFNEYSLLQTGHEIKVTTVDGKSIDAIYQGMDENGQLVVEQNSRQYKYFSATIEKFLP